LFCKGCYPFAELYPAFSREKLKKRVYFNNMDTYGEKKSFAKDFALPVCGVISGLQPEKLKQLINY
jgi:hypothetical protein